MKKTAPVRRTKAPYIYMNFSRVEAGYFYLHPPPGSPMYESDNNINNIFRNYSSHNYIEILSRMHPMHHFIIFFSEEHTLESLQAPHENASEMYYNTPPPPIISKLSHNYMFEHEFLPLIIHSDFSTYDNVLQNVRTYSPRQRKH